MKACSHININVAATIHVERVVTLCLDLCGRVGNARNILFCCFCCEIHQIDFFVILIIDLFIFLAHHV